MWTTPTAHNNNKMFCCGGQKDTKRDRDMEVDHGPAPELKAEWQQITLDEVEFGASLGQGAFGEVFKGKVRSEGSDGSEVALKRFPDEKTFKEVGFNEAAIMVRCF